MAAYEMESSIGRHVLFPFAGVFLALACAGTPVPTPRGEAIDATMESLKRELAASRFRAIITLREDDADSAAILPADRIRVIAAQVAERHDLAIDRIFSIIPAFVAVVDTSRLASLVSDANVLRVEPDRPVRPTRSP